MPQYSTEDQALALAGVFQAASLVDQIARQGHAPEGPFDCSIRSLLREDVDRVVDVFGDRFGIRLGLRQLVTLLEKRQEAQQGEIIRYGLMLLFLERKLRERDDLIDLIRKRLGDIAQRVDDSTVLEQTHIQELAAIYTETLSTLPQRIQVKGEPEHLQQEENADKIRALLLAGIRAAVLWRQTGGRRWKLLFSRRAVVDAARRLST